MTDDNQKKNPCPQRAQRSVLTQRSLAADSSPETIPCEHDDRCGQPLPVFALDPVATVGDLIAVLLGSRLGDLRVLGGGSRRLMAHKLRQAVEVLAAQLESIERGGALELGGVPTAVVSLVAFAMVEVGRDLGSTREQILGLQLAERALEQLAERD